MAGAFFSALVTKFSTYQIIPYVIQKNIVL